LVKDEDGDLAHSKYILSGWKNYLSAVECTWG